MSLPQMIYGTAWKQERTKELVIQALQSGFRGIDTACQPKHYREDLVGDGIVASGLNRDELFIQSKFTPLSGQDPQRIPYDPNLSLGEQVAHSFQVSQHNLHVKVIDSYLLHSTQMPMTPLMQIWRAMEKIVKEGGAKQIGVSNCYDINVLKRLYDDAEIKPSVLQNRFYEQSGYDVEIRAFCKDNAITYESFWSLTANPHIVKSATLCSFAQYYNKTNEQVFYRFLTQNAIVPLNGTTSQQHMQDDLDIFDFELTPEQVQTISELLG